MADRTFGVAIARFLLAAFAIFALVFPGLVLLFSSVWAARGVDTISESTIESIGNLAEIIAVVVAIWFIQSRHTIKRLWVFVVVVWVLYYALVGLTVSGPVFSTLPDVGVSILLLLVCVLTYLGAYLLVYRRQSLQEMFE